MPRLLVQFWTEARAYNEDRRRLDSEILRLRDRVWERAAREAARQNRLARFRTAGFYCMSAAVAILYLWCLGR